MGLNAELHQTYIYLFPHIDGQTGCHHFGYHHVCISLMLIIIVFDF
jgi:hypothetical protein